MAYRDRSGAFLGLGSSNRPLPFQQLQDQIMGLVKRDHSGQSCLAVQVGLSYCNLQSFDYHIDVICIAAKAYNQHAKRGPTARLRVIV